MNSTRTGSSKGEFLQRECQPFPWRKALVVVTLTISTLRIPFLLNRYVSLPTIVNDVLDENYNMTNSTLGSPMTAKARIADVPTSRSVNSNNHSSLKDVVDGNYNTTNSTLGSPMTVNATIAHVPISRTIHSANHSSFKAVLDENVNTINATRSSLMTVNATTAYVPTSMIIQSRNRSLFCLQYQGSSGRWVQDWDYAKGAQINLKEIGLDVNSIKPKPSGRQKKRNGSDNTTSTEEHHNVWAELSADRLFRPTKDNPYRWATSWRWEDDYCPVQLATKDRICTILEELAITRIYVVGDSLNSLFTWTLLAMTGHYNLTAFQKQRSERAGFQATITCSTASRSKGGIVMTANSIKTSSDGRQDNDNITTTIPVMFVIAYRTLRANLVANPNFILDNPKRTLIIANIGLHIPTMERFQHEFHKMLDYYDLILSNRTYNNVDHIRKADLMFWRSTNTGHKDCFPRANNFRWNEPLKITPFANYSEYKKTETTMYSWNLMEDYNTYAQGVIETRNEIHRNMYNNKNNDTLSNHSLVKHVQYIRWFNIWNSTVLRRDGHKGGKDCLHYLIPGPIDWWIHMLYSHLLDIANLERVQPHR